MTTQQPIKSVLGVDFQPTSSRLLIVGEQGVDVTKQLKVSDAVYDDLDELKDEEGHTSFDSVLRTLLIHYRHVQPDDQE